MLKNIKTKIKEIIISIVNAQKTFDELREIFRKISILKHYNFKLKIRIKTNVFIYALIEKISTDSQSKNLQSNSRNHEYIVDLTAIKVERFFCFFNYVKLSR